VYLQKLWIEQSRVGEWSFDGLLLLLITVLIAGMGSRPAMTLSCLIVSMMLLLPFGMSAVIVTSLIIISALTWIPLLMARLILMSRWRGGMVPATSGSTTSSPTSSSPACLGSDAQIILLFSHCCCGDASDVNYNIHFIKNCS
jgi:hypothetical protein